MEGTCHIVGASPEERIPFAPQPGDLIIAADGGYEYALKLNITPDIVLGDFDSLGYIPTHAHVLSCPREKDDTDMMLAVRAGLKRGYRHFALYGGLGGRLDHTVANLQTLAFLAKKGARGTLFGQTTHATVIRSDTLRFDTSARGTISIFSLDERAFGVTLCGLQYPLTDATLTNTFPLGVSNAFTGAPSSVSVREGALLILWEAG